MTTIGCPECDALGMGHPRRIWGEHHYDDKGVHHPHNLETGDAEMHCSNGHTWTVHTGKDCCGHPGKAPE